MSTSHLRVVGFYVNSLSFLSVKGSGIHSSEVVPGMVFKREVEGDVKALRDAKIVAFSCPLDSMTTETKVSCVKTAGQCFCYTFKGSYSVRNC